jgi:hypothetical protein
MIDAAHEGTEMPSAGGALDAGTAGGDHPVWSPPWSNAATSRPPRKALEVVRERGENHAPRDAT